MKTDRFEIESLGRNDPCPVCGKKMKNCRGHAGRKRVWAARLFIGIGIACILTLFLWWWRGNDLRQPSTSGQIERYERVLDEYYRGKPAGQWWFITTPRKHEEYTETYAKCAEIEQLLRELVERYHEVTPLTREIASTFTRFYVAIYHDGTMSWQHPGIDDPFALSRIEPNSLLVIFVPKDQIHKLPVGLDHASVMQYHYSWRAVIIFGQAWPDSVLAGLFYHELGHALRDSRHTVGTDEWIDEESEMFWLTAEVLNTVSGDKLFVYLDDVLRRQSFHSSYQSVTHSLTADDLHKFYSCIGPPQPTQETVFALRAAHLIMLGQCLIRTTLPENKWVVHERELFRWVTGLSVPTKS